MAVKCVNKQCCRERAARNAEFGAKTQKGLGLGRREGRGGANQERNFFGGGAVGEGGRDNHDIKPVYDSIITEAVSVLAFGSQAHAGTVVARRASSLSCPLPLLYPQGLFLTLLCLCYC